MQDQTSRTDMLDLTNSLPKCRKTQVQNQDPKTAKTRNFTSTGPIYTRTPPYRSTDWFNELCRGGTRSSLHMGERAKGKSKNLDDLYFRWVHGKKKKERKVVSSSFFITGGVCDVRQGINALVGWLEPVLLCAHAAVWDPETWL